MGVDIHNLVAAINPGLYCQKFRDELGVPVDLRDEVKEIVKEKGYAEAAKKAKIVEQESMDLIDIEDFSPTDKKGLKAPLQRNKLIYDSFGESVEPIYFWLLDKMNDFFKKTEKVVDNFVSSPGSGHFSEMGMKATKMQEEAMKVLGGVNQVIKSILNIIYDLKEFDMRLDVYDKYRKGNESEKENALFSLKQIWMDTVDMKKGNTAIKMMAQQYDYVTLIDAFMVVKNLKELDIPADKGGIDLNERVRRILKQRIQEFFTWIELSEKELRKRYEVEKIYLRSQVNTVQLYARWLKPYLQASGSLEQRAEPTAAIVTNFNTTLFELVLMGYSEYDPSDDIIAGNLPKIFKKTKMRKYYSVMIAEFRFRSVPERTERGYGFRGRTELTLTGYGLREDELNKLKEVIQKEDLKDLVNLIEGSTKDSLDVMAEDLDKYLGKKEDEKKKEEKKNEEDTNPFSALISFFKGKKSSETEKEDIGKKDSYMEEVLRSQAIIKARQKCYKIYDIYKKAHGMPSLPKTV